MQRTFRVAGVGECGFVGDQLPARHDALLDQRPFVVQLASEGAEIVLRTHRAVG